MCWTALSDCLGFVYFSGAATPYVMFKKSSTTEEKADSIRWFEFNQTALGYCDLFSEAVGSGVNTSTCHSQLYGAECDVTCKSGYDQDGDYATDGDTAAATCTADGGWASASDAQSPAARSS